MKTKTWKIVVAVLVALSFLLVGTAAVGKMTVEKCKKGCERGVEYCTKACEEGTANNPNAKGQCSKTCKKAMEKCAEICEKRGNK